jgi:hypothetical protein
MSGDYPPDECAATEAPVDPKPPRVATWETMEPDPPVPVELVREDHDRPEDPPRDDEDELPVEQDVFGFAAPDTALPGACCCGQSVRGIIA